MGFFTKKQVKLSAVAFNLNDFEELNYNQLIEVNGGCGGGFWAEVRNFFSGGKNSSGNSGSASGSSSASRGSSSYSGYSSSGSTSSTTSSSYGGCGGNNTQNEVKMGNVYSETYIRKNIPKQFQKIALEALAKEEAAGIYGSPTDSKRITEVIGSKTSLQDSHTGVDIGGLTRGKKGDPIYAVADGVITRSGYTNSKSSRIEQTLPGTKDTAVYQHAAFIVKAGDTVKRGQIIGYMSDIGTKNNVHLHYEIRKNGVYAGGNNDIPIENPLKHMPSTYYVEK